MNSIIFTISIDRLKVALLDYLQLNQTQHPNVWFWLWLPDEMTIHVITKFLLVSLTRPVCMVSGSNGWLVTACHRTKDAPWAESVWIWSWFRSSIAHNVWLIGSNWGSRCFYALQVNKIKWNNYMNRSLFFENHQVDQLFKHRFLQLFSNNLADRLTPLIGAASYLGIHSN